MTRSLPDLISVCREILAAEQANSRFWGCNGPASEPGREGRVLTQVGHRPANNGALRWPVTNIAALAVLAEIGLAALDEGRGTQIGSFRLWKAPRSYLQLDAQKNRA